MQKVKRGFHPSKTSKVFLILLAVLAVIMTALSIFSRCGLPMIHSEYYLYGSSLMIALLPVWGVLILIKKIKKTTLRRTAYVAAATLLFVLFIICMTMINMFASFALPQYYATIQNNGHTIVVLRGLDSDTERMNIRREMRLEADPEGDPEYITGDFGYIYAAYPRKLGIFYQAKADVEGELYMGYESEAQLMIEWPDENTARFYLDNAGELDGGEWILRF